MVGCFGHDQRKTSQGYSFRMHYFRPPWNWKRILISKYAKTYFFNITITLFCNKQTYMSKFVKTWQRQGNTRAVKSWRRLLCIKNISAHRLDASCDSRAFSISIPRNPTVRHSVAFTIRRSWHLMVTAESSNPRWCQSRPHGCWKGGTGALSPWILKFVVFLIGFL